MSRSLGDIYEPVSVASPPENAFNGLFQLPNGELRHYGFEGPWHDPTTSYYIVSHDNGLTWKRGSESPAGPGTDFLSLRCRRREGTAVVR